MCAARQYGSHYLPEDHFDALVNWLRSMLLTEVDEAEKRIAVWQAERNPKWSADVERWNRSVVAHFEAAGGR
jgi:hypothetical protein